jgi:hypothetical protein
VGLLNLVPVTGRRAHGEHAQLFKARVDGSGEGKEAGKPIFLLFDGNEKYYTIRSY